MDIKKQISIRLWDEFRDFTCVECPLKKECDIITKGYGYSLCMRLDKERN